MRYVLSLPVLLLLAPQVHDAAHAAASQAPSVDQRIAARRAVEDVLWRHRIWPADNPQPKPPLSAVLSDAEIRARVIEDLRKSQALAELWQRPVTAAMLQAELQRMQAGSRAPDVLDEMLDAVGHDPVLAGEAIARPALVDRLIRSWYAQDARFHGDLKNQAESSSGGAAAERTIRKSDAAWDEIHDLVLERAAGRLIDEPDAYRRYVLRESTSNMLRFEVTTWPKRPFESWWDETSKTLTPELTIASGAAPRALEVNTPGSCANNTWHTLGTTTPSPRYGHSAVWTGSEMLVWGGTGPSGSPADGGRYEPATDSWYAMSSTGAPSARAKHGSVWTGTRMVIWGGQPAPETHGPIGTGARYDPTTDTWQPISMVNSAEAREEFTMVWSGTRVLIWGGTGASGTLNTGGVYEPVGDTWSGMSLAGAPSARSRHCAVWAGDRMVIWGGQFAVVPTGGRYDPSTDTWAPVTSVGAPTARNQAAAVWTGSRMLIWGGHASSLAYVGGSYDPVADAWQLMTETNAPADRVEHTAVWTGSRMVVWGGDTDGTNETNDGAIYDPAANTWTPTTLAGAPDRRRLHSAVWTGTEMIVWGGFYHQTGFPNILWYWNSGGRFSPASNSWVPTAMYGYGPPSARQLHAAVWTGSEAILWGGTGVSDFNDGTRYNAATNSWWPTTTSGAPPPRIRHSAVWTGSEMIVWGGGDSLNSGLNTGGRYNPASDSWTATSLLGAPPPTSHHSAVWTGSRMIVWGGIATPAGLTSTGYRYDPGANAWSSISSAGAPSAREDHVAVWTGSRMVVWGGTEFANTNDNGVGTGGRYDPAADSWTSTSPAGAPQGRTGMTGAWTGSEMLVWGGACCFNGSVLQTGGRYNPATDAWTAMTTSGAPQARTESQSVWTGSELIVWGGRFTGVTLDSGGRYLPSKDQWQGVSVTNPPAGRYLHTATWLGDKMLVWGGATSVGNVTNTGATYCACRVFWRDDDGDGYGNGDGGAPTMETCNGTTPAGWVDNGADCWDANPNVNPSRTDNTCNGIDDDCNGAVDDLWIGGLSQCGLGPCRAFGVFECVNGTVINNCTPGTPAAPNDTACNGVDDDCDGGTDEDYVIRQDHWTPIAAAPVTRTNHSTVWTGTEMLVFGGDNGSGTVKVGGEAYNPSTNAWRALPAGPAKRWRHTAVWTGTQMIVWGGDDNVATVYNTGSRYDGVANTWSATTTTGAPAARGGHSAVYNGSRMIIWGGADGPTSMNTGSRYDPSANSWSATTTAGAPTARLFHTAVWANTEMIVWGGQNVFGGTALNTGGRYNPTSNSWTAVTTTGAPTTRYGHVAFWTGSEMIIWGGTDGTSYRSTGARYNPSTNTWTPMSGAGAPPARAFASFAWTGSELLIWGGTSASLKSDGARYNPATDSWTTMSPEATPSARARASGIWTGSDLVVWGGDPNGAALSDGARYAITTQCGTGGCQRTGATYCSGGVSGFQCVPATSMPEVCDGTDNDCDSLIDEGIPVPSGHPYVFATKLGGFGNVRLDWNATPDTTDYDIVSGGLNLLRGTAGDYTVATTLCALDSTPTPSVTDFGAPMGGDGVWFLVRPNNLCSGNGTYDEGVASQSGPRDAEIAASGSACP